MKKLLTAALVGASIVGSALSAYAGAGEGVISSIDAETMTIVLEDGSTWTTAEGVDTSELAPGDAIKVEFEDGTTVLTLIEKM